MIKILHRLINMTGKYKGILQRLNDEGTVGTQFPDYQLFYGGNHG